MLQELDKVADDTSLLAALTRVVDGYYGMFLAEPVMRDIWSATQTDKALLELDVEDGHAHGAMLAHVLRRLKPRRDAMRLESDAFLLMQLIAATVRLAISLSPATGEAMLASFKRLVLQPAALDALGGKGKR